MKKFLYAAVSFVVLGVCAVFLFQNRAQFHILHRVQWYEAGVIVAMTLVLFSLCGYTFKIILGFFDIRLSPVETVGLAVLTNFGNYLGPMGPGSVIRAVYLKSIKGLRYSQNASVLAAHNFLSFFTTALAGLVLFFFFKHVYPDTPWFIFLWSLGLFMVGIFLFVIRMPSVGLKGRIGEVIRSAVDGFHRIRYQGRALILVGLFYILQLVAQALLFQLCFAALGVVLSFFDAFGVVVYVSLFDFALTPGNVGIQEGLGGYFLMLTGHDFGMSVVGLTFLRAVHFGLTFLLTPLVLLLFFKTLNWRRITVETV